MKANAREFSIRGEKYQFMPIEAFRELYHLDEEFAVSLFQPKDYQGLASIEGAGAELHQVYENVLASVPNQSPEMGWQAFLLELQILFRRQLDAINSQIGLKNSEIDYAVLNFGAICQEFLHRLIKNRMSAKPAASFQEVYQDWLNKSLEISTVYLYLHYDELWQIEVVRNAFGRQGFIIQTARSRFYVYDKSLACPAEKFMESLSHAVADKISHGFLVSAD